MPDSPAPPRFTRRQYTVPADTLAERLLGCIIVRENDDGLRITGRIVETEAYMGVLDKACHSFGGRRTPRNEPMYGVPGTAYVYFTYGMHHCFNVVCGAIDDPVAVLIRALEPLEGLDQMRANRATKPGRRGQHHPQKRPPKDADLCRGPASLCRALGISSDLSGTDMLADPRLFITPGKLTATEHSSVTRSPRIGIRSSAEWELRPLRWCVGLSPCLSGPKPSRTLLTP